MDTAPPSYYPRLDTKHASELLVRYTALSVDEIADQVNISFDGASWYPTAPTGSRVDVASLEAFRRSIVEIARAHGYPALPVGKSRKRVAFDRDVVDVISQLLAVQPAEAATDSVWNFLSLVVVPDVALWRWPNADADPLYERLIGRPRNVFRRLWWRSHILGPYAGSIASQLYEDEAVAILERTSIGGNAALSRVIAETHIARFGKREKRTEVLRDAMKRIRRLYAFMMFHALTPDELAAVVAAAFDETELAMFRPRVDFGDGAVKVEIELAKAAAETTATRAQADA
jgi:hypothetical protein